MAHMQREELRRLARASRLAIASQHEDRVIQEISEILTYVQLLQRAIEARAGVGQENSGLLLALRPDAVVQTQNDQLLALAPEQESGYFVVPAIISQEK